MFDKDSAVLTWRVGFPRETGNLFQTLADTGPERIPKENKNTTRNPIQTHSTTQQNARHIYTADASTKSYHPV